MPQYPWPALKRFAEAIGPDGRARLLRILESSEEDRAAAIGRFHLRDDGAVIGLGVTYAYLDVCDEHLTELLRNARPMGDADELTPASSVRAADAPQAREG